MTPFMAFIIVIWAQANPAAPKDRSAVIWREVFPDKKICEVVLADHMEIANKSYGEIKAVTIVGACQPAGPST